MYSISLHFLGLYLCTAYIHPLGVGQLTVVILVELFIIFAIKRGINPIRKFASVPFWGTLDPRMGTINILSQTLFGRTRGAVLSVLYGHVGKTYYLRQLARITDIALGPVQREIRQLVEAGLVNRKTVGTQTLYSANRESPVFRQIKGLVTKTVGMRDVLANALEPLANKINLAFVYGSVARSREHEQSDVDLMVVGNV